MYQKIDHEELEHMLSLTSDDGFEEDIRAMNAMYRLPISEEPTLDNLTTPKGNVEHAHERQVGFLKTLGDEIAEGLLIKAKFSILKQVEQGLKREEIGDLDDVELSSFADLASSDLEEAKRQVLVDQGDWLADIVVYVRSEAMKYGLPLEVIQQVVMGSNFTKLPDDGIPVHDENGKFQKDPKNYRKPENAIYTILFDESLQGEDEFDDEDEDGDIEGSGDDE